MNLPSTKTREIAARRTYKASRSLLMRMWSNPEHLTHWWGPVGFTTTTHQMEFRPGGAWKFTMHGPDGTDYPNLISFTNITDELIEYHHGGPNELVDFHAAVRLLEADGHTEMQFEMRFPSAEDRSRAADLNGAVEGLQMSVARLEEYVATQDPNLMELVIVKRFNAPVARVWRAITDPEELATWSCPHGFTTGQSSSDFAVGGHWTATMVSSEFGSFTREGEYLEVVPTAFLAMTHRWKNADGTYKPNTTVSFRLHEHEGMTTMVFIQSGFASEEARSAHLGGWSSCFHKLGVRLGTILREGVLELTREIQAPQALVWDCWTKPEMLASWFAPRPYTAPRCEMDLRPGGSFLLVMASPQGDEHPMRGFYTDVEPKDLLAYVVAVQGSDGDTALEVGTTVILTLKESGTLLTVRTYAGALTQEGMGMVAGMEPGWNMTLDQLKETAEVH